MLISNTGLVNSCRVCRSPNQDGDYQCLYQQTSHEEQTQLSETGNLYENLLEISLDLKDGCPQYLCNSCDLQMKLFKKLKDKAFKTLEYLQQLYRDQVEETKSDILNEALEFLQEEYANEELQRADANNEQHYEDHEMFNIFQGVEQPGVDQQQDDIIAKLELLEENANNQNEEILQTFQEDQNFESLLMLANEKVNSLEVIPGQYAVEQQMHRIFNDKEESEVTLEEEDEIAKEKQMVEVGPEQYLGEQNSLEVSTEQYVVEQQMQEIFSDKEESELALEEEDEISKEKQVVEDGPEQYLGEQELLAILNDDKKATQEEIAAILGGEQVEEPINGHNEQATQQEITAILGEEHVEDPINSQNEQVLQTFSEENNFESLSSLNHHESQQSSYNIENHSPDNDDDDVISTSKFFAIQLETQDSNIFVDKSDYITEIYELMEDDSNTMQYSETSEHLLEEEMDDCIDSKAESSIAYSDIEYVESCFMESTEGDDRDDEIVKLNPPKKRKRGNVKKIPKSITATTKKKVYNCGPCHQEFQTSKEYNEHRSLLHDGYYPCNVCSKLLKSQPSLITHMRLHNGKPFKCEICRKTFNQKVHFQYHMDHHNNVRNFKCKECDKAFISSTDLKVHMRFHTGNRPFVCDICGKSYLMTEHLKAHSLTHTQEKFQCKLCQLKFVTHKTLKLHISSIHAEEPKFKCEVCLKPFRRKHHLEYHSRLHQKGISLLNTHFELVEESEKFNSSDDGRDDFVDEDECVDDPGYVVINEDEMLM